MKWHFDLGNNEFLSFDTRDVVADFMEPGVYSGFMAINPGTQCADTAFLKVEISPSINLSFEYSYNICSPDPVTFLPSVNLEDSEIITWSWDFGDGNISNQKSPMHNYDEIGDWLVSLTVTTSNNCSEVIESILPWFPIPDIEIEADIYKGCSPLEVEFQNLSFPIDDSYETLWSFGDGKMDNRFSPMHIYEESGSFDVSLEIISPLGCQLTQEYPALITVYPKPIADFSFTPDQPTIFTPEIMFTDESADAISWEWSFDVFDNSLSTKSNLYIPGYRLVSGPINCFFRSRV